MLRVLGVTLLLLTPLLCAPQFEDDQHLLPHEAEGDDAPAIAWSEEATTKHLDLEDPASWSASTEVLDENHAWYRRRRSVDASRVAAAEDVAKDDMEVAEAVVFMPAHLRNRKKLAHEECRMRHIEIASWRRQTNNHHAPTRSHCNSYCCYPVVQV